MPISPQGHRVGNHSAEGGVLPSGRNLGEFANGLAMIATWLCAMVFSSALAAQALAGPAIAVTSQDWVTPVFPWQAPRKEYLLRGPLRIVACAGEYEPATFTLHNMGDREWPNVEVRVTDLRSGKGHHLPASVFRVFAVTCLKRTMLNGAAFINESPGIPKEWKNQSPELLVPLSDTKPTLKPGLCQRFYLNCRVPDLTRAGVYRGDVCVFSGAMRLAAIRLEVEVLPFRLANAPARYWMWRLTWSPIDRPENVACLRDIREHGYTGLARTCGAAFEFRIDGKDRVHVDAASYRAFARVLRETGLALQVADDHVAASLLRAAAEHVGLRRRDVRRDLPDLASELGPQRAEAYQKRIRPLAVQGLRQVKTIAEILGLTLFVFPIDEPCGTPWKRAWTRYAASLAKEAGLTVWSTRNDWDWDADIDIAAAGAMINGMYHDPKLVAQRYEGELALNPLPLVGAFRDGAKYHFRGVIDEVRIYNRAPTPEEMLRQHREPARDGLIAWYSFDNGLRQRKSANGAEEFVVPDESGHGHDAVVAGAPQFEDGKVGRALRLNGRDQHLASSRPAAAIDVSRGWSISLWYRGRGPLFGSGYAFYHEGSQLFYSTTLRQRVGLRLDAHFSARFWCHLTLSVDPASHTIRAYCEDRALRAWHRHNIRWNYMQVRSMPPWAGRYQTGVMAWFYATHGALKNITTFCYDWNATHLYVVYPKNGDRFKNGGVWYPTFGWEACREGIDDARYIQTLVETLQRAKGLNEKQAVDEAARVIAPLTGSYDDISKIMKAFGEYAALRKRIIRAIMKCQQEGERW